MSWFDDSVVLFFIICFAIHIIREEFERSIIRRQLLVEQNLPPNNNIEDEIAPVTFIWRILDKYNIILIHVPNNNSTYTAPNNGTAATADNNNNNSNTIV